MENQTQNTIIKFDKRAEKQLRKLPLNITKKFHKQLSLLFNDPRHPSLHIKKKQGGNRWEARINYHYRFTFVIEEKTIIVLSIGPHDEGLGKK